MKYQAAKCWCQANDIPWTDPRTGITHPAQTDKQTNNQETCSMCGQHPTEQCGDSGCPYNVRT